MTRTELLDLAEKMEAYQITFANIFDMEAHEIRTKAEGIRNYVAHTDTWKARRPEYRKTAS